MLGTSQRDHSKTMWKRRQVLLQLVRWAARRYKVNLVEIEAAIRGSSDGEGAIVNRVERSAKQRDAARMEFCGGALRLRCGQYASQDELLLFSHKSEERA